MRDLWTALRERLTNAQSEALDVLMRLAAEHGTAVYLVGGSVRDLLLERPGFDIDLVVEGDAVHLAQRFALAAGAAARRHQAFGTATVQGEGFRFNLVTARRETYRRPGALPTVQPSNLADDLARRDFTINAMALGLTPGARGTLIDPYRGRDNLAAGLIRVLHGESFRDDATRMLRAVRYTERLGFALEPETLALLERDRTYLETISGARIRHEIERILNEEDPAPMLARLDGLSLLRAIDPALGFGPRAREAYARLRAEAPAEVREAAAWCLLALDAGSDDAPRVAGRLDLNRRQTEAVTCVPGTLALHDGLARADLRPSEAVRVLDGRPAACLWAAALTWGGDPAGDTVRRYLERWRQMRPRLSGRDLQALGVPQGPEIGAVLRRLRQARLDGEVRTAAEERALALRTLARPPEGGVG